MAEEKQNQTAQLKTRQTAPQPEEESHEPKISLTEIFFITPFYLISDSIDLALLSIGLDDLGIMDTVRTSISQFYFVIIKKMGPEIWATNLAVNGIKLFPYIGSLIPSTLVWFIIIFIDKAGMEKLQKVAGKMGKTGEFIKKTAGKISKVAGKI